MILGGERGILSDYECRGNKVEAEDKCRDICGQPPYSTTYGVCEWHWLRFWLKGNCWCYHHYQHKNPNYLI